MLVRIIHRLLGNRHFWRDANFAELAELYATRLLRMMAVGMIAVFVGIYLLRTGYSLSFILAYFAVYFFVRVLFVWPAAHLVARLGPKHGTLYSNLLYVPALLALANLPHLGTTSLVIFGLFQAASVTLYDISYNVNFSKIQTVEHAGKELGFLYIMTKVGSSLSPLVGGLAASLIGPESTIIIAAGLFVVAAAPLFFTPEPTVTHQKLNFRGLPVRSIWRSLVSNVGIGVDFGASGSMWSLYIAIVVLAGSGNNVYAKVGALSSLTLVSAFVTARLFGELIDKRHGSGLLRLGVLANAAIHLTRPYVTSVAGVAGLNVANEVATTAFGMPYVKGMSELASNLPGYRIVFLSYMSATLAAGSALIMGAGAILVYVAGDVPGLKLTYVLAGILALTILGHGFTALKRTR